MNFPKDRKIIAPGLRWISCRGLVVLWLAAVLVVSLPAAQAQLRFFSSFGTGAVLQREMPVPVWGWAKPGDLVTVAFAGQTVAGRASDDGRWKVILDPLVTNATGTSLVATSSSGETVTSTDVLVGEVWFCSGQSNMAEPINTSDTYATERARPANPLLRMFRSVDSTGSVNIVYTTPQNDISGSWISANTTNLANVLWSATGYYFSRRLQAELGVPVGIITSAVGATSIQIWLPAVALDRTYPSDANSKYLQRLRDDASTLNTDGSVKIQGGLKAQLALIAEGKLTVTKNIYCTLYNGQIAPHAGTAIRGMIWYQGEANRGDAMRYFTYLHALIDTWREAWNRPDLPFHIVQIAPYQYSTPATLNSPNIWEAQTNILTVPGTSLITTLDAGQLTNIHPIYKKTVGERIALQAMRRQYGYNIISDPPLYLSHQVNGANIDVKFRNVGTGLAASDSQPLTWFTIAGSDNVFQTANATIIAPDTIRVTSAAVASPTSVRFAWLDTAQPNLVNSGGIPAGAFHTDTYPPAFTGGPTTQPYNLPVPVVPAVVSESSPVLSSSAVSASTAGLTWTDPNSAPKTWRIQYTPTPAINETPTTWFNEITVADAATDTATLANLWSSRIYAIRVRAEYSSASVGPWSTPVWITSGSQVKVADWRQINFSTPIGSGNSADNADADGEGWPNLLEYALGTSPGSADSDVGITSGVTEPAPGYLFLQARRGSRRPDVALKVETSSDLQNWKSDSSATTVITDTATELTARDNTSTAGPRFIRLKASTP
ncbi:MAG: sialate O-acetylesterase [Verrucomicrobiota bacterium]